eukprot:11729881-Ditylum_brightwellii.AAC.1
MAASIEALFILMGFPEPNRRRIALAIMERELQHWHKMRKSFYIRQVATLTGEIQNICSVTTWGTYIYMDIQHSVAVSLAGNSISLKATSTRYKKLEQCIKAERISSDDELRAHFAQSYKWETPIALLIPRDPDFTADGDSSLIPAG